MSPFRSFTFLTACAAVGLLAGPAAGQDDAAPAPAEVRPLTFEEIYGANRWTSPGACRGG